MLDITGTTVTIVGDPRITIFGAFLRRYKLDELPQLVNVLVGDMALVGPRPDVPGFLDTLDDLRKDRLSELRPGITGLASLMFKHEEEILASVENPEEYNLHVLWPKKVKLNIEYANNINLLFDIQLIFKTLFDHD